MKIALHGCGRVGKALLRHWKEKGFAAQIVYIANSKGQWKDAQGIGEERIEKFLGGTLHPDQEKEALRETLTTIRPDIWFELTPSRLEEAEAVHERLLRVLEAGIHVISANKAPILHDYPALQEAGKKSKAMIGLSAVMGAALPTYALGHYGTLGSKIVSIEGILNGTTNFLLEQMEEGKSFEESIERAVSSGIAETDWSYDVDGIDAAVKMSILAAVLEKKNFPLEMEKIQGIREISRDIVLERKKQGRRIKLVATLREGEIRVEPREFLNSDLFYHVEGAQKALHVVTKDLSEMTLIGGRSGLPEVAASLHRDLCWIMEER